MLMPPFIVMKKFKPILWIDMVSSGLVTTRLKSSMSVHSDYTKYNTIFVVCPTSLQSLKLNSLA